MYCQATQALACQALQRPLILYPIEHSKALTGARCALMSLARAISETSLELPARLALACVAGIEAPRIRTLDTEMSLKATFPPPPPPPHALTNECPSNIAFPFLFLFCWGGGGGGGGEALFRVGRKRESSGWEYKKGYVS